MQKKRSLSASAILLAIVRPTIISVTTGMAFTVAILMFG